MKKLTDQCLIRYNVHKRGEVTGIIRQEGEIFFVYWEHLGHEQPEKDEDNTQEIWYTQEAWLEDDDLVAVHDPIETKLDVDMWLMLYPEDKDFIRKHYSYISTTD